MREAEEEEKEEEDEKEKEEEEIVEIEKRGRRKVVVGKKGDGMEICLERGSSDVIMKKV